MHKAEIIAYHGWGFDARCWDHWQKMLGDAFIIKCHEAGYFGSPFKGPSFSEKEIPKIVMVHSFGLHVCPENYFKEADLLIVFSGFLQFHPVATQYKRRSRLVLNQMMNRLEKDPQKVLHDFYEHTFYPGESWVVPKEDPKIELLLEDLKALDTHKITPGVMKKADKMCILHGSEDAIVHRRKGRELYESFRKKSQYFEIINAGHALPFTHGEQCWQFIEPEIKKLIS